MLVKAACRRVSLGLVQAEVLKDQFAGLIPEERIQVVHNTVDTELYKNPVPERFTPKRVFFMGHLSCAKGYCDVLSAIPAVARRHPEVKFVFAGTRLETERNVFFNQLTGAPINCSPPHESLETLEASGFGRHHRYVGVVEEPEKLELLASCCLFLLPSYSEGFSQAVLEAWPWPNR
nr:glycosyltransferase [Desulfosarcina cetonica]